MNPYFRNTLLKIAEFSNIGFLNETLSHLSFRQSSIFFCALFGIFTYAFTVNNLVKNQSFS